MKKLSITGHVIKGMPAGYCLNNIHRGYLSDYLMQKHKCLPKKCKYFIGIKYNSTYQPRKRKSKRDNYENFKKH